MRDTTSGRDHVPSAESQEPSDAAGRSEDASSRRKDSPDPETRHRKSVFRISDLPAWTGAVGTVVAVVAAVIAYEQVHLANVQSESAKRDSLVTLVTDIAQATRNLATSPPSQDAVFREERLADAAQGLALVDALNNDHVPAIDNYELGLAFYGSGEYADALKSYRRAAASGDVHYRASSLRGIAQILYYIGGATNVHQAQIDIREAYSAWDGKPDVARFQIDQNKEVTDLDDARFTAAIDCARARSEIADAKRRTAADPVSPDATVKYDLTLAANAMKEHCGAA